MIGEFVFFPSLRVFPEELLLPSVAAAVATGALLGMLCLFIYRSVPGKWLRERDDGNGVLRPAGIGACLGSAFAGGLYFLLAVMFCPETEVIAGLLLVLPALYAASVSDIKNGVIPDQSAVFIVFAALVMLGLTAVLQKDAGLLPELLQSSLIGGLAACGGMLILANGTKKLLGRETFGMGDIKLFTAAGFYVGLEALVVLAAAAFMLAAVPAAVRLIRSKSGNIKNASLPFGPFIAAGMFVTALFTDITPV